MTTATQTEATHDLWPILAHLPENYVASNEDTAALKALIGNTRAFKAGHVFKRFQQPDADMVVLLNGIAARTRMTPRGKRRIVDFQLPGEFSVSLTGDEIGANYELVAMGDCIAATLPRHELRALEARHPKIGMLIEWNAQREIAALQDKLVSETGTTVEDKLMFLLSDLHRRLSKVRQTKGNAMQIPLRQHDMADAIGASTVQVCKVLSRMRSAGKLQTRYARRAMDVAFSDDLLPQHGLKAAND